MSVTETETRAAYIAGLHALADLLDSTPELPLPDDRGVSWYLFGSSTDGEKKFSDDEQKARAADLVRWLPGKQRKWETGDLFRFVGSIGGIRTEVIVDRAAVCRRVVTGTREVTKAVPSPDAPMVEVTETIEDVEWVCEPLLAEVSA
jgi:hypothetical protein